MERLIKSKVEAGRVAIQWLGQGGFAFKGHDSGVLVVDPYLSDSANADGNAARLVDIPVRPKDVRLDYLFLTHDHDDHTDPHSAPAIAQANPEAPVICPPSSCRHLTKLGVPSSQITTAMPGQSLEFPGFVAHVVAAQHTEDSVGFVFEFANGGSETDSVSVYITGDTEYNDGLAAAVEEFGPEVLLVPINGRWGNMDAAQAARLTAEIAPARGYPHALRDVRGKHGGPGGLSLPSGRRHAVRTRDRSGRDEAQCLPYLLPGRSRSRANTPKRRPVRPAPAPPIPATSIKTACAAPAAAGECVRGRGLAWSKSG